jgi:hypothetical protein
MEEGEDYRYDLSALKKQIDASEARRQRRKGIGQNLSLCRI